MIFFFFYLINYIIITSFLSLFLPCKPSQITPLLSFKLITHVFINSCYIHAHICIGFLKTKVCSTCQIFSYGVGFKFNQRVIDWPPLQQCHDCTSGCILLGRLVLLFQGSKLGRRIDAFLPYYSA